MRIIDILIKSNVFISVAAVALTIETQIQLGMTPQWHPYVLLIFFATLVEYNLHRLITVLTNKEALASDKHRWVIEHRALFYALVGLSIVGFLITTLQAQPIVLLALAPFAVITLLYSFPIPITSRGVTRFRQIPYLKIFLIAITWSSISIFLPVSQTQQVFSKPHIALIFIERVLFVFAITIPFDIRDMGTDKKYGLKTIPLLIGERLSIRLSIASLCAVLILSCIHYMYTHQWGIAIALIVSTTTTMLCIGSRRVQRLRHYHYGVLDGTMILQGALVLAAQFSIQ